MDPNTGRELEASKQGPNSEGDLAGARPRDAAAASSVANDSRSPVYEIRKKNPYNG